MVRHLPAFLAAALLALPVSASAEQPDVKAVYLKRCKNCHGEDGRAQTRMGRKHDIKSFADPEWQRQTTDEEIRKAIADGVPDTKMKGYKDKLKPAEIDALARYVRELGKSAGPSDAAAK